MFGTYITLFCVFIAGIPAVAISGASAANALINPIQHWMCLDSLDV
jgi:hypothetical protein